MKLNTTELEAAINTLNMQITTLKTELAANTQAIGKNTIAVEGITGELGSLAAETGGWRKDDKNHHEKEGELDQQKIEKIENLTVSVKELIDVLKK